MEKELGERIKNLRKSSGITQTEFAEKLNIHPQTISKWERGVSEPDISQMGEIANILGVSLEKLFGCTEGEQSFVGYFSAEKLGTYISTLRTAKNESQQQLAEICLASVDTISRWERGITCPGVKDMQRLSEHFDVLVSKLYYAVSEEEAAPVTVKVKKKRTTIAILSSAIAVLTVALIAMLTLLLLNQPTYYTVMVDDEKYSVNQDSWFTPSVKEKIGYDFVGWIDEDGNSVSVPCMITDNCELTAVYKPHEYYIEYWLNGGVFNDAEVSRSFTVESGEVLLPTPDKKGATFEGWYLTASYNGEAVTKIDCSAENKVLYAKWSDKVYTIRYELDGGTMYENNPTIVTQENEIQLTSPIKMGYLFLGWYDSNSDKKYEFVGGAAAQNLLLQARWQKSEESFSITYELDGGEMNAGNPTQIKAGEIAELLASEKIGHEFIGWNEVADGTGKFVEKVYGQGKDITLYAIFQPKEYLIKYAYDGFYLTDNVNPNYIVFGESVTLIPVSKYGYDFVGWYDKEDGGNLIEKIDTDNITTLTTLYAHFAIHTYDIILEGNGGKFLTPEGEIGYYCYKLPFNGELQLPESNREGYDFLGWKSSTGEWMEKVNITNMGDMHLTAVWREKSKTYKVTFDCLGGEVENGVTREMHCGKTEPLPEPVKNGYLFLGWNEKSDESGTMYTATDIEWENDLTLYAVWQEIKVNGSSEFFRYEKGADSVTITEYLGESGMDVDVVFPSIIDGLPVKAIRCSLFQNVIGISTYHSIFIPEGVQELGEGAFSSINVLQPITIPSTVIEIGEGCFENVFSEIYFAEGNQLETIKTHTFCEAKISNVLVLPSTVKSIQFEAFYHASFEGIVLPEGLTTIMREAFRGNFLADIYLPSTVTTVETSAINSPVYTSKSREECENLNYDRSFYWHFNQVAHTIILKDGDWQEEHNEKYLVLPKREKSGYTFLGWQNENGEFVSSVFIPSVDTVLTAVYEEKTSADGRTKSTPIIVKPGEIFQITLKSGGDLFLIIDTLKEINCFLSLGENVNLCLFREITVVDKGEVFSYSPGTCLAFKLYDIFKPITITVTIVEV